MLNGDDLLSQLRLEEMAVGHEKVRLSFNGEIAIIQEIFISRYDL